MSAPQQANNLPLYLSLFLILIKLKPVLPANLDQLGVTFSAYFLLEILLSQVLPFCPERQGTAAIIKLHF